MELKDKLIALRKEKGLSQAELSEAIKVSRQAISRWEVGSAIPSADNLMWLSKFYEVSLDELMDASVDGERDKSEDNPSVAESVDGERNKGEDDPTVAKTEGTPKNSKNLFIFICALVVVAFLAIFVIFYDMFHDAGKEEAYIKDPESWEYMPSDIIDMDIKPLTPSLQEKEERKMNKAIGHSMKVDHLLIKNF